MTSKAVYMIGDVDIKNIEEYKKYMEELKKNGDMDWDSVSTTWSGGMSDLFDSDLSDFSDEGAYFWEEPFDIEGEMRPR